jgi:hypothetical protein
MGEWPQEAETLSTLRSNQVATAAAGAALFTATAPQSSVGSTYVEISMIGRDGRVVN